MKKVLIGLDYDSSAQKIAETGYALAKSMGAQVILLHVISDYLYYSSLGYSPILGYDGFSSPDPMQADTIDNVEKGVQDYLDSTKRHLGDDAIQTIIKDGNFAEVIVDTAIELQVDIIVLGTHGRRGLDKILMGSVAEKVLGESTIPLLIIPTKGV